MSREGKGTPPISIIPFSIFATVVLSTLVIGFPIWKSLVIFSTIDNNEPVDREKTIRPADKKRSADIEKLVPADVKKPVVIYYKYQY